jgi:hypothetical protein
MAAGLPFRPTGQGVPSDIAQYTTGMGEMGGCGGSVWPAFSRARVLAPIPYPLPEPLTLRVLA